ncbi:MAG: hypothetical protein IIB99_02625 [Planctomycetes bacterium]|nr:hypothetical protein [Planctomycetota bacterium]
MRLEIFFGSVAAAGAVIVVAQLNAGGDLDSSDEQVAETVTNQVGEGGVSAGAIGPDVIYSNCQSVTNWGVVGGIRGYSLGSYTCNIGDENLLWGNSHNGTPGLAMNAYRLYNGRLMQVGMSWVKHACCAAAGDGCGMDCNGVGGAWLGVGCRDIYSAGYNGGQSRLGPRSDLNPYSGDWQAAPGGSGNAIFRRLQVVESDITEANFPNSIYFVEGVYVATDDAQWGNWLNNASYRQVTLGPDFDLVVTGPMYETIPAILAWHDHGNGINVPDESVQIVNVDVPEEGRFYAAAKASDNDDGTWRYEYALFNLNSHRSGGSLSVPIPPGAAVSNVGFHDVDYHSGEVYDNTDWEIAVGDTSVVWSSPATFAENPNTNALRWGTMYNFWFDADVEPAPGDVTLGLFRPGTPESVAFTVVVPRQNCVGDIDGDGDGDVGVKDLLVLLGSWGPCPKKGDCPADFDNSGDVGVKDLLILLGNWGPCP